MTKRIVIDLDLTLTKENESGPKNYATMPANDEVVKKLKSYKKLGYEVIIYTARNMKTYNNSVGLITAKTLPIIHEWLFKNNIPFDEIHIGKPWCGTDGFYVDDKAIRPDEFVNLTEDEIKKLIK